VINSILKNNENSNILNIHKMNNTKRYLVGNYDLEILTIPRIIFKDVKIKQSQITDIIIPHYGTVHVNKSKGPASLFLKKNGQNIWLYDFDNISLIENLNIQPGSYFISFRSDRSNSTAQTIIKNFKISSNQNINLKL
jgi:Ca-activated chloride channel family protein